MEKLLQLLNEFEGTSFDENSEIEKIEEINYRAFDTTLGKFVKGTFPNKKLLLKNVIKTYLSNYEVSLLDKEIYKIIEIFLKKQGVTIVKVY